MTRAPRQPADVPQPPPPSDAAFEAEVVALLTRLGIPRAEAADAGWGHGDDRVAVVAERSGDEAAEVAALRAYRGALAAAGLSWVDGPEQYGGRGLPRRYAGLLREIESRYAVPDDGYLRFSVSTLTPTLLQHGSASQQAYYLPRLRSAQLIACQLYSEPGAGSDLAGLATRAVRDRDGWLITGQKVWSSGAHLSDLGLCIARTDTNAPKHAGLTTFLVDLRAPGVEVRPIRQLTGGASFDEVFLTGVRVPDAQRVGPVNGGWAVVVTSLLCERGAIGHEAGVDDALVARLVDLARHAGAARDERARDRVADIAVRAWAAQRTTRRLLQAGPEPGPELAMTKLMTTELLTRIADAAAELLGCSHVADTGEWGTYAWSELTLGIPGLRIGGGTDEILRNAIGERVLGLPKEQR